MLPTISLLFPFFLEFRAAGIWTTAHRFQNQWATRYTITKFLPSLQYTLSWEGGSQILTKSYLFSWSMIGSSLSIYFGIFIFPTNNPMVSARIMDVTAARTRAKALRFAIYCATKHNSLSFLSSLVYQIYIQKFNESFL